MVNIGDNSCTQTNVIEIIDDESTRQLPTNAYQTRFVRASSSHGIPVHHTIPPKIDKYRLSAKIIAYRISLKAALTDPNRVKAASAESAMRDELKQLMESLRIFSGKINIRRKHISALSYLLMI